MDTTAREVLGGIWYSVFVLSPGTVKTLDKLEADFLADIGRITSAVLA